MQRDPCRVQEMNLLERTSRHQPTHEPMPEQAELRQVFSTGLELANEDPLGKYNSSKVEQGANAHSSHLNQDIPPMAVWICKPPVQAM